MCNCYYHFAYCIFDKVLIYFYTVDYWIFRCWVDVVLGSRGRNRERRRPTEYTTARFGYSFVGYNLWPVQHHCSAGRRVPPVHRSYAQNSIRFYLDIAYVWYPHAGIVRRIQRHGVGISCRTRFYNPFARIVFQHWPNVSPFKLGGAISAFARALK